MATWLEDTIQAFENLGGVSALGALYNEVKRIRSKPLPKTTEAMIRSIIETHSSDSQIFGGNDVFYSIEGIGHGVWGLRKLILPTPRAPDITEPHEIERIKLETYRILRDTALARSLKALYKNQCQICGSALRLADNSSYSEAHHIRPLGTPHNGLDISGNIIVLCPNHHVLCDYGAITLDINQLRLHPQHAISTELISYHNSNIVRGR